MNKKGIFLTILLLVAASLLFYFIGVSRSSADSKKQTAQADQNQAQSKSERKVLYWVDSMHPSYKSDKPGIAPDCGMKLTPVYADDTAPSAPKPGTVRLTGRKQQLINLKVVEVSDQHLMNDLRTVGTLQYDETKVVKIHSKIEGWIEKVYVDYTGGFVRKGQPLFSIYSPELVATQQEYLLAVKADRTLQHSEFADVSSGASALRESAYSRLRLWDVSDQQIKKLEETGKPLTSIAFYSPVSGFVITKNVFDKQRIDYNTEAYSIADLSTIWLMADVYEYEAQNVHVGQKATMTLSYNPEKKYAGTVTYIYPDLNSTTRTLKARIEFRNPGYELKPGMYANVELDTGHGRGLVVPVDAVLDSGERKIVFVQKSEGEFEPREVELGPYLENNVVITKGLQAGEKVVASGNFLIDSESRLKTALESMQ
jgi:Cu(I)/Ag(I) efflux system membrane fusion protein